MDLQRPYLIPSLLFLLSKPLTNCRWFWLLMLVCACSLISVPGESCAQGGIGGQAGFKAFQSQFRSRFPIQDEVGDQQSGATEGRVQIREADLPTFYLERENGELAPFFQMPFEEFEEIYRLYRGIDEGELPPRYSISQISIDGYADQRLAYLDVEIQIRANAEGWIEVPLQLDNCILRSRESTIGDNVAFLSVGRDERGLACWLNGKEGDETQLQLKVVCPLEALGTQFGLKVPLPVSASSRLNLKLPFTNAVVEVNDEGTLQEVTHPDEGETQFIVFGRPGGFDVTWRKREAMSTVGVELAVESQATLLFDNVEQARWQYAIDATGIGGAIESFRVLLPSGIQIVPSDSSDYVVEVLDEGENDRREVIVTLSRPAERTPTILINGLQSWTESSLGGFKKVQGIEVRNAIRHRGRFDIFVAGRELTIDWEEPRRMVSSPSDRGLPDTPFLRSFGDSQVTPSPAVSMAGFEFTSQPCGVSLRVERQPTSITAEPVVTLTATRDQVRLDARYRLSLSGSLTSQLILDLGDWNQDVIIFGDVVERFSAEPTDPRRYIVELDLAKLAKQPEFEIGIEAVTPLSPGLREFDLTFPIPVGARLQQTTLLIEQEKSLVIRPQREAMQPVPESTIPEWHTRSELTTSSNVYRGLVNEQRKKIAFDLSLRPQTIAYRAIVDVNMTPANIGVVTRFNFEVKHQPLRSLGLEIPQSAFADSDVLVRMGDQSWNFAREELVSSQPDVFDAILEFDEPLIGQETLEIEFSISPSRILESANDEPASSSESDSSIEQEPNSAKTFGVAWIRPFVESSRIDKSPVIFPNVIGSAEPSDANRELLSHRLLQLNLTHPFTYDLAPKGKIWDQRESLEQDQDLVTKYVTAQTLDSLEITLEIRSDRRRFGLHPGIERLWVQTHLLGADRQDRAAFSIRTQQSELTFVLPMNASLRQVAVNNQPVENPYEEMKDGRRQVTLSLEGLDEELQLIEFWYGFRLTETENQTVQFDWPRLEGVAWVDRMYWQLVVPSNQYLIWSSDRFSVEHIWKLGSLLVDRQSRLGQRELELWVGAESQTDIVPGSNVYLFSGFGDIGVGQAQLVPRSWILVVGSGSAFLIGLLLIYFRRLRSPLLILVAMVMAIPLAWSHPQLSLLILQVALLGVLCTTVAFVFRHGLSKAGGIESAESSSQAEPASTSIRQGLSPTARGSSLERESNSLPEAETSSV